MQALIDGDIVALIGAVWCDKFDWRARLNQQYRRIAKSDTKAISWIAKEGRSL